MNLNQTSSKKSLGVKECPMPLKEELNFSVIKTEPADDSEASNDPLSFSRSAAIKEEPTDNCHSSRETSKYYGSITIEINNNGKRTYKFTCDVCQESFSDVDSFDEHINVRHWKPEMENVTKEDLVVAEILTTPAILCETNQTDDNDDESDKDDNEDDASEPKVKKAKISARKSKILHLDYPDKYCVTTFLELLKTHAILWLKRQSIRKRYDEAANSLLDTFNRKFADFEMTREDLIKSIHRIKTQRTTPAKTKDKPSPKAKSHEYYLQLCTEIDEKSEEFINKCDNCKAIFYSPEELQVHRYKIHKVGKLPYTCEDCGYGFAVPETYASHVEKHKQEKNFHCEICGLSFYYESNLNNHKSVHSTEKTHICEICGQMTSSAANLKNHKKTHAARNHVCKICAKSYIEKWQLLDHMKAHQNEKNYICKLCDKSFNRQKNLYLHKRTVHKNMGQSLKTQPEKNDNEVVAAAAAASNGETNAEDESESKEKFQSSFFQLWSSVV